MRHALARVDREQALAYLEASKPQNVPFYQRYGFEVTGEIQIGAAPLVTPAAPPASAVQPLEGINNVGANHQARRVRR